MALKRDFVCELCGSECEEGYEGKLVINGKMVFGWVCNDCLTYPYSDNEPKDFMTYKELEDKVYNYPTKHEEGFMREEMQALVNEMNLNLASFYEKLGVNTGLMKGKDSITYHTDVLKGIVCVLENHEQNIFEFD